MKSETPPLPFAELALSICAGLLFCLTSILGIGAPDWTYATIDQKTALIPNDIVNLLIGLPWLGAMIWLAGRGHLWARLCWPGALLYIIYNSLIAVFSLYRQPVFLLHLVQLALCTAILWFMWSRLDRTVLLTRTAGGNWEKAAGGILTGMGVLFLARAIALILGAREQSFFSSVEYAVTLADLIFSFFWIFAGVALLREEVYGVLGAAAGISQLIALYVGLMLVMHIQPLMTGAPLAIGDFLVIAVMSMSVLIPGLVFISRLENNMPEDLYK